MDNTIEQLINEHEVARLTGLSLASIRRRRLFKLPPAYVKLGARVLYRPSDVAAWINENTIPVASTAAPAHGQSEQRGGRD